jgi:hypothetical protein
MGIFAALLLCFGVHAQESAVSLQEKAANRFRELHQRMQQLQIDKAGTHPEESDILKAGNRYIQEKNLNESLAECKRLIEEANYDEALQRMEQVRRDMTSLLDLLLNRDLDLRKLMEEIASLEQFKERVEDLIEEQPEEKDRAARAAALQKHLEDLEKAIDKVDEIVAEQTELREEANSAGLAAEPDAAKAMEVKEAGLRGATEQLEQKLEDIEAQAKELAAGEGAETGAQEFGQEAAGSASGSAGAAAQAMGGAESKLQQNKPESSLQDMDKAIDDLSEAKKTLEEMRAEAQRQLLELPFDEQAKAQENTRIDTDKLAQDMEAASKPEGEEAPKPVPGQQNVQQAVPKQKSAAGSLKEYKPDDASQDQQDALDELAEAQEKLDDALAQLRQELKDEVLRSLEERFGAMLAKQKELSARTKAAQRLRESRLVAEGQVPGEVKTRCGEIATGETELAAEANDAIKLLEEEGSTAVFPAATEMIRDDLQLTAARLQEFKSGRTTQMLQRDIEDALSELVDALRKQIEAGEGQAGQTDGQPPLVPMSAELKLLLAKQKRVNRNTLEYDTQVPEQMRVTEEARDEALQISRKERWVKEMTRKLADAINKQNQERAK